MSAIETLRGRLANGEVVVIDGGMGVELDRRGVRIDPAAWAATAVLDDQDTVQACHEDFIRAGADVIITNTYLGGHKALAVAGLADRTEEINRRSVDAAIAARDKAADRPVVIAGSIFPGFIGPDWGSIEFPTEDDDVDILRSNIREQANVLVDAGVDLIALEMVPTGWWGRLAMAELEQLHVPIWLGTTYGHAEIVDGPDYLFPIDPPGQVGEQVRQILADTTADVMAVTVMHTEIKDIDRALDDIERHWQGPLGVYPHHCEHIPEPPGIRPLPIAPDDFAEAARRWVDRGVQIVGGCCAIGPEHIAALKQQLPTKVPEAARRA
jgi:S-methylmethionine-dependent homocysteine/selenocysteine methylase